MAPVRKTRSPQITAEFGPEYLDAFQISSMLDVPIRREGRIVGVGKTIRIKSIRMHYELAVPAESREATERALTLHPQGCPAHQSVQGAIDVSWDARVRIGEETVLFESGPEPPAA